MEIYPLASSQSWSTNLPGCKWYTWLHWLIGFHRISWALNPWHFRVCLPHNWAPPTSTVSRFVWHLSTGLPSLQQAANNCCNCLNNCFNAQVSSGSGDSNFSEPTSLWISECQKRFAPYFDSVNFGFRFSSLAGVHWYHLISQFKRCLGARQRTCVTETNMFIWHILPPWISNIKAFHGINRVR